MSRMDTVWMTQAALERLEQQLAELDRPGRDLSEAETVRARQLRDLIRRAEVGQKPDDGLVEPGMRVTIRFERDGSETTFLFGDRSLAELDGDVDVDVFGPSSPLGEAINGKRVGDTVAYAAPAGEQSVTIVAATPFG